MKELTPSAQLFLDELTSEFAAVIKDYIANSESEASMLWNLTNDKFALGHLLFSFRCPVADEAKGYRNVFNKEMATCKSQRNIKFSNNSFINHLYRIAEGLISAEKSNTILHGHGVSGLRAKGQVTPGMSNSRLSYSRDQSTGMPSFTTTGDFDSTRGHD